MCYRCHKFLSNHKMKLPTKAKVEPPEKNEEHADQEIAGSNGWKTYEVVRVDVRPGTAKGKFEAKVYKSDGTIRKIVITSKVKYFNDLEDEQRRRERNYPLD